MPPRLALLVALCTVTPALAADALPKDAVARFGNTDWRLGAPAQHVTFLPNDTLLAVNENYEAVFLDAKGNVTRRFSVAGPEAKVSVPLVNSLRDNQHPHHHRTLATADGKLLATPGVDGTLRVWDTTTEKVVFTAAEKLPNPAVAFAGDASRLAVRTDFYEVTVFDTTTWKAVCVTKQANKSGLLMRIELSGDGKRLVECGRTAATPTTQPQPQVTVWDADTGKEVLRVTDGFRKPPGGFAEQIDESDITADASLLVKPYIAGLAFHDLTTGKESFVIPAAKGENAHTARFVDGGKKVFATHSGKPGETILAVYDMAEKKELHRVSVSWKSHLIKPWGFFTGYWPSPDGKRVAVGYGTGLRVYEFASGKQIAPSDSLPLSAVTHLSFAADGKVVSGTRDFDFHRWDVTTGKGEAIKVPGEPKFFATLSPDGNTFVVGEQSGGGPVKVYDAASGAKRYEPKTEPLNPQQVRPGGPIDTSRAEFPTLTQGANVFFTPDSKFFVLNQREGPSRVFETATGKQVPKVGFDSRRESGGGGFGGTGGSPMGQFPFAVSGDSESILFVPFAGPTSVAGVATWEPLADRLTYLPSRVGVGRNLAWSPDQRLLASTVRAAALPSFTPLAAPAVPNLTPGLQPVPPGRPRPAPTTPAKMEEGVVIAELGSGRLRAVVKLTTPANENLPPSALLTPEYLQATHLPPLVFSPDGRLLAFCTPENGVKVWGVYGNAELATFTGHTGEITALAFSPDGSKLVSGAADGVALVWDLVAVRKKAAEGTGLDDAKLKEAWEKLAGLEPPVPGRMTALESERPGQAIAALIGDPTKSVPFLREKLSPAGDAKRIPALIADLSSADAAVRRSALAELDGLGAAAQLPLRAAMKKTKFTDEVVTELNKPAPPPSSGYRSPGALRVARAVEVLEVLAAGGSKDAADLIKELGTAANDRPAVAEAYDAHLRLTRKK